MLENVERTLYLTLGVILSIPALAVAYALLCRRKKNVCLKTLDEETPFSG